MNITERTQAAKALQRALDERDHEVASYRSVFEAGSEGYIIHDNGVIIEVNPQFEELTGHKNSELVGKSFIKLVAEESRDLVIERMSTRPGKPFEIVGLKSDGSRIPLEVVGKEHSYQGRTVRVVSVRDLRETKQAQETLRASEERYRDYYDQAPDAYLSVDPQSGLVIECNQTTADMLGWQKDEIVGHKVFEFYAPDSFERVNAALTELSARGVLHDVELQLLRKDGSHVDVSLEATAVKDEAGRVIRSRSMWRDITDRVEREKALRESEARFSTAFHDNPVPVAISKEEDAKLIDVNDAFLSLTGLRRSEAIGRSAGELGLLVDPDALGRAAQAVRERGTLPDYPVQLSTKTGEVIDVLATITQIEVEGEPCLLTTIVDVTERKRLEQELQEIHDDLESKVEREMDRGNSYKLTFREFTVLHLIADGKADKEIGVELGISIYTVHRHVSKILAKMESPSRTEAGTRALREGLLD